MNSRHQYESIEGRNIIAGSYFGGDATFHFGSGHERPLHELLPIAHQAPFDASDRQDDPLCLEDTRTEVLKEIRAWVYGKEASCIFWLNGMAGTGKSTIARTIAQELSSKEYLGASFFFVRGGGDVSHAGMFFSSIAYQLAIRQPNVKHHVVEAVRQQPDIATKSRTEQWRQLIVQPLDKAKGQTRQPIVALVVDALDECDSDNDMKGLVAVLAQARDVTGVRLRIIVTSRPETPIRLGFKKMPEILHRDLLLHEVPREIIDADICLFLYDQLEEVREMYSLPKEWPGVDHINQLVCASAGLFIFAATMCRFLQECVMSVEDALNMLLPQSGLQGYDEGRGESTRFLDAMYSQILVRSPAPTARRAALEEARNPVKDMLGAIAALSEPLSVGSLASLLGVRESDINQRLSRLHSVVRIPATTELPIRLFHTSLRDFLFNAQRSSDSGFTIDRQDINAQLLHHCLVAMRSTLRRDMCNLSNPGYKTSQVDRDVVNACIPSHVRYACQYWVHHFCEAQLDSDAISDFFYAHVVYWIEAMSLIGRVAEAIHMVVLLRETTIASEPFVDFLQDTLRFLLFSRVGIEEAPLQTYEFALLFAPRASNIRQKFSHEMPKWISRIGHEEEEWDACLQVLVGHSDWVNAVAFSPDGKTLASASIDHTVRLWDTTSGRSVHELVGHSNWVNAVAFSPDGKTLASASGDHTVRLWDTTSGRSVHELVGHSDYVNAVAFSPDGKTLASASGDHMVRLWDTISGRSVHGLVGHSNWVNAVAFSPDGKTLASASGDHTVRLWDTISGRSVHGLVGHSDWVNAVAFSPDGKTLASASDDHMVRLWDTTSGRSVHELVGHSDRVNAVAFSPDGKTVASASRDHTVRLWDTTSGAPLQSICDVGYITALSFSHNGTRLETNNGPIGLGQTEPLTTHAVPLSPGYMHVEGGWLYLYQRPLLWLPPKYGAACSSTRSNVIAIGHPSGLVSLWSIDKDST